MIQHLPFQISAHQVEDVIASPWIRPQELKYLFASLYNIGIVLYRNKELNKVEYMCAISTLSFLASYKFSMQTSMKTG